MRTRQSTKVSIDNHEKGMKNAFYSPLTMKLNLFCASKNHIPREKIVNIFTFAYGQAVSGDPIPRTAVNIRVFFTASLIGLKYFVL